MPKVRKRRSSKASPIRSSTKSSASSSKSSPFARDGKEWIPDEDLILLQSQIQFGNVWRFFSLNVLKGRSEHSVKNRFHLLTAKKGISVRLALQNLKDNYPSSAKKLGDLKGPSRKIRSKVKRFSPERSVVGPDVGARKIVALHSYTIMKPQIVSTPMHQKLYQEQGVVKAASWENSNEFDNKLRQTCTISSVSDSTGPNKLFEMFEDSKLFRCNTLISSEKYLTPQYAPPNPIENRSVTYGKTKEPCIVSPSDVDEPVIKSPPSLKRHCFVHIEASVTSTPTSKTRGNESILSALSPEAFHNAPVVASPNGDVSLTACFRNAEFGHALGVMTIK